MKYSSWPFNQTVPVLSSAIWNLLNHLRLRKSTQLNSACIYTSLNHIQMHLKALLSEARSSRSLQSEREATAARTNSQWEETLRRFQANTKREAEEIKIKVESEWPENMLQFSLKTYRIFSIDRPLTFVLCLLFRVSASQLCVFLSICVQPSRWGDSSRLTESNMGF